MRIELGLVQAFSSQAYSKGKGGDVELGFACQRVFSLFPPLRVKEVKTGPNAEIPPGAVGTARLALFPAAFALEQASNPSRVCLLTDRFFFLSLFSATMATAPYNYSYIFKYIIIGKSQVPSS